MKTLIKISFVLSLLIFASCESEESKKERLAQLEADRIEKEINDKYISNSLSTGSVPYAQYYGPNTSCNDNDCSEIRVTTSNSDVIVTIKKDNVVVQHAFIKAGGTYTFTFPNGTYQPFFYYGKGWNPEKEMKGGQMKGGFVANEVFGKDQPQTLNNNVLTYELILKQDGNFSTKPSNPEEAL
jgi:hypothetical protein